MFSSLTLDFKNKSVCVCVCVAEGEGGVSSMTLMFIVY